MKSSHLLLVLLLAVFLGATLLYLNNRSYLPAQVITTPGEPVVQTTSQAVTVPVPADETQLPESEKTKYPVKTKVSTDTPTWGDGDAMVTGNSVTVE